MHQVAVAVHYLFQVIWHFLQVIVFELKYSNYLFEENCLLKLIDSFPGLLRLIYYLLIMYSYFK